MNGRVWRHLVILAGAGLVTVTGIMVFPLIWPPDPDSSLTLTNGQLVGETVGYIWQTDAESGTIYVSASLLGLRRLPVTVTAGTKITVGEKFGAFANLVHNAPVRIVYESHADVRLASSIKVLGPGELAAALEARPATPPPVEHAPAVGYWLEVGLFADPKATDGLMARLLEQNLPVSIEPATSRDGRHSVLRVQVGPYADEAAAIIAQQNLSAIGYQAQIADARAPARR
jgi:hypothetical protein